jgi:hypothetical protein
MFFVTAPEQATLIFRWMNTTLLSTSATSERWQPLASVAPYTRPAS